MKENILYLREMGMYDNRLPGDIKNHRVRVLENIDIVFEGTAYNMFFEFWQFERNHYRTTNKRTGQPLKKAVIESVNPNATAIDTQFERDEYDERRGFSWQSSWRHSQLEKVFYDEDKCYTRADILDIVNRYKVGPKFTKLVLVEEEARRIINTIGGYREKEILGAGKDFHTEGSSYMEIGDTWTEDHKVIRINKQEWEKTTNGKKLVVTDFCEVDLVTGKITA